MIHVPLGVFSAEIQRVPSLILVDEIGEIFLKSYANLPEALPPVFFRASHGKIVKN